MSWQFLSGSTILQKWDTEWRTHIPAYQRVADWATIERWYRTSIDHVLFRYAVFFDYFDVVITTPSPENCLSILCPKSSAKVPPPTIFLLPISQSILPSPTDVNSSQLSRGESPRSTNSHEKHPQSESSEDSLPFGLEIIRQLNNSPHGVAHIVIVALCRKGEVWDEETIGRLTQSGIRDILNVPCDSSAVGGLYMV